MTKKILFWICLSVVLIACSSTKEPTQTEATVAEFVNDYPTRDRVEYVFNCIAKHGGPSFVNQYACGCKIDKIAEKLTFAEYEGARTFSYLRKTPGENGAVFRDPEHAKNLRRRLKEAEAYAEAQCFVMSKAN